MTDSYGYTLFGEVKDYTASVSGVGVYTSSFTYDKLGRISTKTETVNGETHTCQYGYDSIGQLTDVWVDGSLKSHYDYDSNGNRVGGTYDDQDRMIKYGENTYQYSANGELQQKVTPTGKTKYEYDVVRNLTSVSLADGRKIEYTVDGANRRVGKKVNGVLVQGWLYLDGLKPVAELDGNGNVVARFVYGINSVTPDYVIKDGIKYRIICDYQGSPRFVINSETGQIVQQMKYDEFGNVTFDTNPGFQSFGFAGGLYDNDTKLVRYGLRDYDLETGRWTSKDPISFNGGENLYVYCDNDPINYLDSLGLCKLQNRPKSANHPAFNPCGNLIGLIGVVIIGKPHGTPEHQAATIREANAVPNAKEIYYNRALKTAGLVGNDRSDATVIVNEGQDAIIEVRSPSQKVGTAAGDALLTKTQRMQLNNPNANVKPIVELGNKTAGGAGCGDNLMRTYNGIAHNPNTEE